MEKNQEKTEIVLEKLKGMFPEREFNPRSFLSIDFNAWKLADIKKFLVVNNMMKGMSKAKKENLVIVAKTTWEDICSNSYCSSDFSAINDDDLTKIPDSVLMSPSSSSVSLNSPPPCPSPSPSILSSPGSISPFPTLQKYPNTQESMTESDFYSWTVQQLQNYLADRGINKSGNKAKLVKNAFSTYKLKLPIVTNDAAEELFEVKCDRSKKLLLENGLVTLPDPKTIDNEWVAAPYLLPETLYSNVMSYLSKQDAGKAYKGGKSLLESGHLINIMVNTISPNLRYLFVRGLCHLEQKLSKAAYDVWVCIHKDSGEIMTGDCSCIAGAAGFCKHIGALLWYVEEQVRLGNNKTCTSKKQKWSVPSKKQQSLHSPEILDNIGIIKPTAKRVLSSPPSERKKSRSTFDPRAPFHRATEPLNRFDIDTLADITNGNSGIVCLLRKPASDVESFNNLDNPIRFETVVTSEHIDAPKPLENIDLSEVETLSDFYKLIDITEAERELVQNLTKEQSNSATWFEYRLHRITASKFKDAVIKVNDNLVIKNPDKCRTFISKVCGYYPKFSSKSTEWGITNEPIARHMYFKMFKSKHKHFTVTEGGFFINIEDPIIGASPDGLVNCSCHEPGILEIKCPWSARDMTIDEFAKSKQSCLEIESSNSKVRLNRNHQYYYQVQCQMLCTSRYWCDFFICTSKDLFVERIEFDETFINISLTKAKIAYERIILPELKFQAVRKELDDEKCVNEIVLDLVEKVCLFEKDFVDMDIDFDLDMELEMAL